MSPSDQHPSAEGETFCTNLTQVSTGSPIDANLDQPEASSRINSIADAEAPAVQCGGAELDVAATLISLQPSERVRKKTSFHEHYKDVEAALARGVTQAVVRDALKRMGLSLSAATFRKMLDAERRQNQAASDEHAHSTADGLSTSIVTGTGGC